jgi:methyl-accepting chemotaxis protein
MDETTQQNAALVEEASAAARAMEEQAGRLASTIAAFKLEKTPTPASVRKTATSRAETAKLASAAAHRAGPVARAARMRKPTAAAAAAATDQDWDEF